MTTDQSLLVDDTEEIINQIMTGVVALEDPSTSEPPVLHDSIDGDALAALVTSSSPPLEVRFNYAGYTIVVNAHEELTATVRIDPT